MSTIAGTLKDIRNFSVLLFICLYTYTLLGLELFSNRMRFNEDDEYDVENGTSPRRNFDSFTAAFTTIFNVLQGEDWHLIMFDAMRSVGWASTFFFHSLVILG